MESRNHKVVRVAQKPITNPQRAHQIQTLGESGLGTAIRVGAEREESAIKNQVKAFSPTFQVQVQVQVQFYFHSIISDDKI